MRTRFILALLAALPLTAQVRLIGRAEFPAAAEDRSGWTDLSAPGVPQNRLGAWGSALRWTGAGDEYLACPDRGPNDGSSGWRIRCHRIALRLTGDASAPVVFELLATVPLRDEGGRALVGTMSRYAGADGRAPLRYDPEGVAPGGAGGFFVSEEYGPSIDEFDAAGTRVRRLETPAKFLIAHPGAQIDLELRGNASGRQSNRGFEGLSLTPSGSYLFAAPQSPLLQDGGIDRDLKRVGLNVRIVRLPLAGGPARESVVVLDDKGLGISEILALDDERALVLVRDGKAGREARYKRVLLADFSAATDVAGIERLPQVGLPRGVNAARVSPLIDLLDARWGLSGANAPEKYEALSWGPERPDGARLLWVATDNDLTDAPTHLLAFAVRIPGARPRR